MTTITARDENILYSPYNWDVNSERARTITPGAYLRMTIDGNPTILTANFDVSNNAANTVRVAFRVDGTAWTEHDLSSAITLSLPSANTWATRVVEMVFTAQSLTVERWAFPGACALEFTGITGDVPIATRVIRRRPLIGMAVGDSITQGVRNKTNTLYPGYLNDDSRLGWAYPLIDLLGAEIGVVGYAGVGLSRSGSGGVPKFPESAPYLWEGKPRTYTSPSEPDFIVAHLGTNDAGSADASVLADTTALLNHWIAATTETPILVMPGWMQRKTAQIQQAIAACSAPHRVTFIDTAGWWNTSDSPDGLHPYGYVHLTDLAPRVAGEIRTALRALESPANVFIRSSEGNAVPLSAAVF